MVCLQNSFYANLVVPRGVGGAKEIGQRGPMKKPGQGPHRDDGHEHLALLVDHSPDVLLIVSQQGLITFANATSLELLGYRPEELIGQSPEILLSQDIRVAHRQYRRAYDLAPTRRSMGRLNTLTAVKKGGEIIPVDIALSPISNQGQGPVTAVAIRDARQQRALVHELEHLATTDPLTGALNRRSFDNAYAREWERAKRAKNHLFVMLLDIDHFKKINDQYGHAAGDKALIQLVSTCKSTLRKTDVLARIGGEEFAILSPADDAAEVMTLAERLRENVMKITVSAEASVFSFTVSIGVADADPGEKTATGILARADQAMYEAKHSGRNRVIRNSRVAC